MRVLTLIAVVAVLVVGVDRADARLSRTTAYLAALRDAQALASELGATTSYSTPACKRISQRRIDCRVWAEGSDFVVDLDDDYYRHTRCRWVVTTREIRFYPYSRSFRRGVRCRTWTSDSSFG